MSVCQYYLRGNCRYGTRCRMPHENSHQPGERYPDDPTFRPRPSRPPIDPKFNYVAPSVVNKNHHVANANASGKSSSKYGGVFAWAAENFPNAEKALDILEQLQKEARAWQKSEHFWRFTSRSLFPGGQPLKDWHDRSFEEMRWIYRCMTNEGQEHVYRKSYYDYFEMTERYLFGLAKLRIDVLESLKEYINEYVLSDYKASKTLLSDVEMTDVNGDTTSNILPSTESRNYTPDDQLLEEERAAYESDTFEFGIIPVHPPPKKLC